MVKWGVVYDNEVFLFCSTPGTLHNVEAFNLFRKKTGLHRR